MADETPEKKPFPFETRRGVFHPYTYVPFLGWLPPTELNILIAFVAIMVAIFLPGIMRRRHRAKDLANLTVLRQSLERFENEKKRSPKDLDELVAAAGLKKPPEVDLLPLHDISDVEKSALGGEDTGDLRYAPPAPGRDYGLVFINCTHTDLRGRVWSQY